jgi:hypothetical protein
MSDAVSAKAETTAVESRTEKPTMINDDGMPPDVAALMEQFSGDKYKKLMRKLDLHLIPIVSRLRIPARRGRIEQVLIVASSDCRLVPSCLFGSVSLTHAVCMLLKDRC